MMLAVFTDLGSSQVVAREAAIADRDHVVATYLRARALLTLLTVLVGAAIVPLAFESSARVPALLALLLLPAAGPSFLAPLGQVYGTMRGYRTTTIVQGALTLAFTVACLLAFSNPSPAMLVAAVVAAATVATGVAALELRSQIGTLPRRVTRNHVVTMLRRTVLLGLTGVLVSVYYRVDGVLLLHLRGPEAAGQYAAAYRLLDQARIVPWAITIPAAGMLARSLSPGGMLAFQVDRSLTRMSTLAGLGLVCTVVAVGPIAVKLLYGGQFASSADLFLVLASTLAWSPIAFVATARAINSRREVAYLLIAGAGLALNVGLNLLLIPKHGAHGAATATVGTELATVGALVASTRKTSSSGHQLLYTGAAVCAGATATAVGLASLRGSALVHYGTAVALACIGAGALMYAFVTMRRDLDPSV
jgi:O-antigen/teichoic acid export membrane protein